jgi:hypothetical protein
MVIHSAQTSRLCNTHSSIGRVKYSQRIHLSRLRSSFSFQSFFSLPFFLKVDSIIEREELCVCIGLYRRRDTQQTIDKYNKDCGATGREEGNLYIIFIDRDIYCDALIWGGCWEMIGTQTKGLYFLFFLFA